MILLIKYCEKLKHLKKSNVSQIKNQDKTLENLI